MRQDDLRGDPEITEVDEQKREVEHTRLTSSTSRAVQFVELQPGAVLGGRYQIEATLGQGGSGTVYRAWDRVLGEPIAVKVLRPDRAAERSWIKRLAREVKLARVIRHPNVCRIFELGHADGHWFLTMELGAGGTLRDLLDDKTATQRPLAERLADARAICAGLAAIHAVGIIHRDVTPANVLRLADGRLVLSDFGLAIPMTANTTVHGGTPNYMPPETLLGSRGDQRADVWQLGVILHEVLFGARPTFHHEGDAAKMRWPLPIEASSVEEELARLCADCLASNPASRPATAMAVAGRLAAAEGARPRRPMQRLWLRARGMARRHRRLASVAAAALCLAGVVRAVQISERPRFCRSAGERLDGVWDVDTKTRVRQAFEETGKAYAADTFWSVDRLVQDYLARWGGMYTEACEATHVRGEQSEEVLDLRMGCLRERLDGVKSLTQLLAHADGAVVDNAVAASSALASLERCADPRLLRNVLPPPDDAATREQVARLRAGIADAKALHDAGVERLALVKLRELIADARRTRYAPVESEALLLFGEVASLTGENDAAYGAFKEVLLRSEAARYDEVKAEALVYLVLAAGRRSRFEEADDWAGQADATLQRIGGHDQMRAWLEMHVAINRRLQGRYDEALAHDRLALQLKQRSGASRGEIARSLNNQAVILQDMGRPQEAVTLFHRAVGDLTQELGAEHPLAAKFMANEAESLDKLGRRDEARATYRRALTIEERGYGPESTNLAYPLTGLGVSYLSDRQPALAVAPLERARRIREAHESDPLLVADTNFALARALWDAGQDRERAVRLAEGAGKVYGQKPTFAARAAEIDRWLDERSRG
ncbi:MAG TPA: serine/threonine-protein kinase [Polyangia bacterium]|nr:serine/threonine-protein kinase [Polyangia bacterium]